jgi:hypothetical protein
VQAIRIATTTTTTAATATATTAAAATLQLPLPRVHKQSQWQELLLLLLPAAGTLGAGAAAASGPPLPVCPSSPTLVRVTASVAFILVSSHQRPPWQLQPVKAACLFNFQTQVVHRPILQHLATQRYIADETLMISQCPTEQCKVVAAKRPHQQLEQPAIIAAAAAAAAAAGAAMSSCQWIWWDVDGCHC